ncbi:MAG: hypothetical protein IPM13_11665 [Phycisphaerales bacterium]|nr:hypothetical protein [Phycisphaerales bacterium]
MRRSGTLAAAMMVLVIVTSGGLVAATYDMTVNSGASGLLASTNFTADTAGTLIGAYDPNTDPTNTRTKPGAFGSFGDTENVPVQVTLDFGLGGNIDTAPVGGFALTLNPGAGTLSIDNLQIDLLGGSPVALTATITLLTETFRTRNPTSLYVGGIPITIPIGQVELSQLTATQEAASGAGTLTPTGPGTYDFTAAVPVLITSSADFFGTPLEPPPSPGVLALEGQIVISGTTATLTSVQPIAFSQSQEPNQPLPAIPLALPTILPPGDTANVILNLVLQTTTFSFNGTNTLVASGQGPAAMPGDMDCDGDVDFDDIDPFVLALGGQAVYELLYPDCNWLNADCNGDGQVTFDDIDPFVSLIGG